MTSSFDIKVSRFRRKIDVALSMSHENGCESEFKDNNENDPDKVSHKIDLKVVWLHSGHAASVEVEGPVMLGVKIWNM